MSNRPINEPKSIAAAGCEPESNTDAARFEKELSNFNEELLALTIKLRDRLVSFSREPVNKLEPEESQDYNSPYFCDLRDSMNTGYASIDKLAYIIDNLEL